jgi:hypothetical protein
MDRDALLRRLLSPAGFILVTFCFLLPFVTVSCSSPGTNASTSGSFTGVDLVAGGPASIASNPQVRANLHPMSTAPGPSDALIEEPMGRQPLVVGALAVVALGLLAAGLPWVWWRALAGAGLALIAGVLLIGGQVLARRTALDRTRTGLAGLVGDSSTRLTITVSNGSGFWLAITLLALLAGSWLTILVRESRRRPVPSGPPGSGGPTEPSSEETLRPPG